MSQVEEQGSLRSILWTDSKNAGVACVFGLLAVALVDFVATLWVAPGHLRFATVLRLAVVELCLSGVLAVIALPLLVCLTASARLLVYALRGKGSLDGPARYPGLLGPARTPTEAGRAAGWLWGLSIAAGLYLLASTVLTLRLGAMFKEPQLTSLVLAGIQLGLGAVLLIFAYLIALGASYLGARLHERLGPLNVFGRVVAAEICILLLAWPAVSATLRGMPQLAPLVPWRHLLSLLSFVLGCYGATQLLARRGRLLPSDVKRRLQVLAACVFASAVLLPVTLLRIGANQDTKALAISSSPTLSSTMDLVRRATDFDRDGFGSLLGENDCGPFDSKIHPLARDVPDNGIDENCDGRDFELGKLPSYKMGERLPVPEAYRADWNYLLITIDTVRYDHTTMGGHPRDQTPELAKFASRSANFTFANAPSAGTMASVPSILTSKYFHSGIALDEDVPRGSPPKLKEQNLLLPELFKEKGYKTGAILSHEYFNDWGMEQGVDDYDNTIGKVRAPYAVTSDKLADRGISWIGKQGAAKWFLWIHFIDPHGRYVSHPGDKSYGESEEDIYDGELHFTDKHLARLLDYLARSPAGKRTVVAITSDHGDGFGEHGYINHGQDLHRELLHVPLVIYVPNIEPRDIPGAVSPIDIFPTFADLLGVDISDLNVEGESLVPQLFYGKDNEERTVFAETNYPKPLRAAVNTRYKLILDMKNNVTRLWDLKKDPLEKQEIRGKDKKGLDEMRGYLNEWIERVVYARDQESNQAIGKLKDHLVRERPSTATPVAGLSVDAGKILVDSFELGDGPRYGGSLVNLALYFRTEQKSKEDFKIQVESYLLKGPNASQSAKTTLRLTGEGMFPTSRWDRGELVRDRFELKLPAAWKSEAAGTQVMIGIRFKSASGAQPSMSGSLREGSGDLYVVGSFKLDAAPAPAEPATPLTPAKQPAKPAMQRALPGKTPALKPQP